MVESPKMYQREEGIKTGGRLRSRGQRRTEKGGKGVVG
jgi:hypothetical protein